VERFEAADLCGIGGRASGTPRSSLRPVATAAAHLAGCARWPATADITMDDDQLKMEAEELRRRLQQGRGEPRPDPEPAWATRMRDWLALLQAAPDRDSEIARELFYLAMNDEVPAPEARAPMYAFWDAIDMAKKGSHGDLAEERGKLDQFLRRWSQ
jgi:hypothetical protein